MKLTLSPEPNQTPLEERANRKIWVVTVVTAVLIVAIAVTFFLLRKVVL
jgi:hypothetical protein